MNIKRTMGPMIDRFAGQSALNRIIVLLMQNGCDCKCGHVIHNDDCERCLACRIGAVISQQVADRG